MYALVILYAHEAQKSFARMSRDNARGIRTPPASPVAARATRRCRSTTATPVQYRIVCTIIIIIIIVIELIGTKTRPRAFYPKRSARPPPPPF